MSSVITTVTSRRLQNKTAGDEMYNLLSNEGVGKLYVWRMLYLVSILHLRIDPAVADCRSSENTLTGTGNAGNSAPRWTRPVDRERK